MPTWLSQTSNGPSRSARNATHLPSGETAAACSAPSKLVKRVNVALASGFSEASRGRLVSRRPTAAASAATATHGSHLPRSFATVAQRHPPAGAASLPDPDSSFNSSSAIFTSPMCWMRRSGSFRRQRAINFSSSGGASLAIALTGLGSLSRMAESVDNLVSP